MHYVKPGTLGRAGQSAISNSQNYHTISLFVCFFITIVEQTTDTLMAMK